MARKSKGVSRFIKIIGILFGCWVIFSWIYSAIRSEFDDFDNDSEYVDLDDQDFDFDDDEEDDYERPGTKEENEETRLG